MGLLRRSIHDGLAMVEMDHGKNPLGPEMVDELSRTVSDLAADGDVRGLVLTSAHERFFSIGLDIPTLIDMSMEEFSAFLDSYNRLCLDLYALPFPTIAAVNGHATAGGCIIALCCDRRYMVQGRSIMGVNEVRLGVPVPYHADRILHDIVGSRNAMEMMMSGDFYPPDRLLELGVVDRIVSPDDLVAAAAGRVRELGSSPLEAFAIIKSNRTGPVIAWIEEKREVKDREFVELWYSDVVRERLREAMEKF